MRNYIYGHTSEETAREVSDYPWGYRLRTEQRYWIESKKNFGQRFVYQTKNPKTGRWCKPKPGQYEGCLAMYENEDGHIKCGGYGKHNATEETVREFIATHGENMTPYQVEHCKTAIAIAQVMAKVTFEIVPRSIGPVSLLSQEPEDLAKIEAMKKESQEHEAKQKESFDQINQAIGHVRGSVQI